MFAPVPAVLHEEDVHTLPREIFTRVDSLAAVFFDHVARHRPLSAAAVAGLQAGLFVGAEAQRAGLADEVATLDQVLSSVRAGGDVTNAAASALTTKMELPCTLASTAPGHQLSACGLSEGVVLGGETS